MIKLTLRPSVVDFGWVLDFGDGPVRPATTWYSEEHSQLVISNSDMSRLPSECIALVEKFETAMIAHISECERQRYMRVFNCEPEGL